MLIQLRSRVGDEKTLAPLIGKRARPEHATLRLVGQADVYKPDGQPLLLLRPRAVSVGAAEAAKPFLRQAEQYGGPSRPAYSGLQVGFRRKETGELSRTTQPIADNGKRAIVPSAIGGFSDRSARFPYCRQSRMSAAYVEEWTAFRPLIEEVAAAMRLVVPKRYAAQAAVVARTRPEYVIAGTPFTTVTINDTYAGGYHKDAGDYEPGFGCMVVFRTGAYSGCELVVPGFGLAVDLQDRDMVFFDVHELHGNTPFVAEGAPRVDYSRYSVVFYFRDRMVDCLAPHEELERAKLSGRSGFRGGREAL